MELISLKIASLSEDIRQIADNMNGVKVEMIRFCRDHPEPLVLPDNKPVLNITQDEFIGIFNMNLNHYFLHPDQVLRIGMFFNLSFARMIALMLKAEWELFLSLVLGNSWITQGNLSSSLKDPELVQKYLSGFRPDIAKYNNLINDVYFSDKRPVPYSKVDFLIRGLVTSKFLISNILIKKYFPENDLTEDLFLANVTEPQRIEYFKAKERYHLKSFELENFLYMLEKRKRDNLNVEDSYFRKFHKSVAIISQLTYKLEEDKITLKTKLANPEWSDEMVKSVVRDKLLKASKEKEEILNKISRGLNFIDLSNSETTSVSDAYVYSYIQNYKNMLNKLRFLTHPDTCPNYNYLSQDGTKEIDEIFFYLSVMKSDFEKTCSYAPQLLLHNLPDYEKLRSVYFKVCEILNINPENFEIGDRLEILIALGTSYYGVMEFLKNETESFTAKISHFELIQMDYVNELQTQIYREALENESAHEETLKNEITRLKTKIEYYERKIPPELKRAVK